MKSKMVHRYETGADGRRVYTNLETGETRVLCPESETRVLPAAIGRTGLPLVVERRLGLTAPEKPVAPPVDLVAARVRRLTGKPS